MRQAAGERNKMVEVDDVFLSCVCFLCVDEPDGSGAVRPVPTATAFLVGVPLGSTPPASVDYVVTARHCIEQARARGKNTIYIRFNSKAGDFKEVPTDVDDWLPHNTADVAAIQFPTDALPGGLAAKDVDAASLSMSTFVGPGPHYEWEGEIPDYGKKVIRFVVGHEIYLTGLFTEHYGKERNLPIARFGHISRMPGTVEIESAGGRAEITAYLAEFQSWGGQSGSPVFFWHPMMAQTDVTDSGGNTIRTTYDLMHATAFLGLIHGHYDIPSTQETKGIGEIQLKLNSGIAIVTPAEAVIQLLMREDFVEDREKIRKQASSET